MNQSPGESQLRALLQRVKRADEEAAATFDDVLNRPASESPQMPSRRVSPRRAQLSFAACVIAAVLLAIFVRPQPRDTDGDHELIVAETPVGPTESSPVQPDDHAPTQAVVRIDFDELLKVVEQHSDLANAGAGNMSVWSSSSDSLLAVNLNASVFEE